jgi:molybdopterin converting factor subunit 1
MSQSQSQSAPQKCQILFFSVLKDCVGQAELSWPLPRPMPVGELYAACCVDFPALQQWHAALLMAVNQAYVSGEHLVNPGDEVAFMPPVQGG